MLVIRNVCNDWLIGTGAFPAMPGFWRQPLGSPAFHPSFQGCWSTSDVEVADIIIGSRGAAMPIKLPSDLSRQAF